MGIEERNRVESQIHETEKQLENFKDQLEQSKMEEIKGKIEELRGALGDDNVDAPALREKWQEMQNITMETFSEAYKKNAAANSDGSEQPAEENKDQKKE